MSTQFRTLNDIVRAFSDIAGRHLQIKTFFIGQDFDLGNDTARHSILAINPIAAVMPKNENGYSSYTVDISIKVLDLVNKDLSNEQEVMSDSLETLKDVVTELNTHPYYIDSDFNLINDVNFTPARGVFDSDLTGWEATMTIEAPNRNYFCGLPMEDLNGTTYYPDLFSNVRNSDDTYNTTVIVSETLTLPDITHTDSDLSPVTLPAQTPMICTPGGGGLDATEIIKDTDANILYTDVIAAGATNNREIQDSVVNNSNSSYIVSVLAEGGLVLPNIDFTDSDGSTVSVPSMEDLVCTPAVSQSGIVYFPPSLTGQTVSYRTGDDANNPLSYTPVPYPVSFATLSNFTTLNNNNVDGNTNRFVDNGDGTITDHHTDYMIADTEMSSDTWNNLIDTANASTLAGYSDWFLGNIDEIQSFENRGQNDVFNFSPFNWTGNSYHSSSTDQVDTTRALTMDANTTTGRIRAIAKTTSRNGILMRRIF